MLDTFFTPRSIALVGASLEKEKLGNQILKNVVQAGFQGHVYPVNNKAKPGATLAGLPVYQDLSSIPEAVDLCIVVVPSRFAVSVVQECGTNNIGAVAVITAGFKETGKKGAELEAKLMETAAALDVRVLGPNILGLIDTHHSLNASFAPTYPPTGNIAFISQSGALGCTVLDQCREQYIGISKFISLGNKADLDEVDFISFLKDDPQTEVILCYLESINRGAEFIEVARETVKSKPIVMIKSGRSQAGRKAASSHTGSLSGADEAYEVAFEETGIIRAKTVAEAFAIVRGFAPGRLPRGGKVLLVTNAGGAGIMATDACDDYSVELTDLPAETKLILKENLPSASSISNPLDILGDAGPDRFKFTLETVLPSPAVDAILLLATPQTTTEPEKTAKIVRQVCAKHNKPVLGCFMGAEVMNPAVPVLNGAGIPNYKDPDSAVRVLRSMIQYSSRQEEKQEQTRRFSLDTKNTRMLLEEERSRGVLEIGGGKALEIMGTYGIPVTVNRLARTAENAVAIAAEIGGLVVMKIESPRILHKSDIGGVRVGVEQEAVARVFGEIMSNALAVVGSKTDIEGISIQPLVRKGIEILVGAVKDSTFGHLIRFGLGGKYVELFRDFSTRLVPLSPGKIKSMIAETKIAATLLEGFRDEPGGNRQLVEDTLLKLSYLLQDMPWIEEIEANPLVVWPEGGLIIDARITIAKKGG